MGRTGLLVCVATASVALAGHPVARAADQPPLPAALVAALAEPEHRAALLQAAHAVDGPGVPACPDAKYTTTGEVGLLAPVQVDAAGRVTAGAWKEQVQQVGCGLDRVLNALTTVGPNGVLETRPMLPGSTITDPQLQRDSVPYAASGLGGMPAGCEQGGVVDTSFLGVDGQPPGTRPSQGSPPRPWRELWTLQACAKRAQVEMRFTPDPTGTEIRATPAKP